MICESAEGSVYSVNKREFVKRISTEHAARDNVMEQIKIRLDWRNQRLSEVLEARQTVINAPSAVKSYPDKKSPQAAKQHSPLRSQGPTEKPSNEGQSSPDLSVKKTTKEFFVKDKKKNEQRLKYMQDFLAKMSGEAKSPPKKYKKSYSPLLMKSKQSKLTDSIKKSHVELEVSSSQTLPNHQNRSVNNDKPGPSFFFRLKGDSKVSLTEDDHFVKTSIDQQKPLPKFKRIQLIDKSSVNPLNSMDHPLITSPPPSIKNNGSFFSTNLYQIHQGFNKNYLQLQGRLPLLMMKDQRSKTEANIEKTLSTLERSWRESEESLGFPKLDLSKLGPLSAKSNGNASLKLQNLLEIESHSLREPKNFPGVFRGKSFKKNQLLSNSLSEEQIPEISRIVLKQKRK